MRAEPARLLAGVLSGLVLLTGCTEGAALDVGPDGPAAAPEETAASLPEVASYVALGDSFTAAPFVPTTDLAEGCFRSDANYPALLAEELEPERFADVSCSAATTADVTGPQLTVGGRGRVPAQLRAVGRGTELVTVGIGANDEDVFARLQEGCTVRGRTGRCAALMREMRPALDTIRRNVAGVLGRVQRKAPRATVVLVGYPRLSAPARPCRRLPVSGAVLRDLAGFERGLNRALRRAAREADAGFVDMHAVSQGHEICSGDPWVNGERTDDTRALAYHPFAAGQHAVAREVLLLLERGARR